MLRPPLLLAFLALLTCARPASGQQPGPPPVPATPGPATLVPPAPEQPVPAEPEEPGSGEEGGETQQEAGQQEGAGETAPDSAPPGDTSEQSSLELVRVGAEDGKERRIRIVRTGTSDESGVFTICTPLDGEPEDAPNVAVFSESGPGGIEITIDKNLIRVPYALVTQRPAREGQQGSDGRVEASAGTARFLDEVPEGAEDRLTRCGVAVEPQTRPGAVQVTQGKTQLRGQKVVYDESDGIARIEGPITFERQDQAEPLSGTSDSIEVNVDEEKLVLVGNVVLRSEGGRVSRAARIEYDDTRNEARLYGTPEQPAESVKGGERFVAGTIVYNLERNEVYAVRPEGGTITGEFPDSEPEAAPQVPAPATPDPAQPQN